MSQFWDDRYKETPWVYGEQPNAYFKSFIDTHQPGSILLPADGESRNGLYAAFRGWEVDAFDFSAVAREKALAAAIVKGLSIHYDLLSVEEYQPVKQYDAIGLIYSHLPADIRKPFYLKLLKSLKPGGHIVLEMYTPAQLQYNTGGPKDISMLMTTGLIREELPGIQFEYLEELEMNLEEGTFHSGLSAIVRGTGIRS